MSLSPTDYLQHILAELQYLQEHSNTLEWKEFIRDEMVCRAYVRSLEIIGEATKQLPASLRDPYSQVNWRDMARMRDRLIHAYFSVDYEIVWDVVRNEVPEVRQEIEQIIESERPGG